jgi:hypothetical protein
MGLTITEDCIIRKDGTIVCWDRAAQRLCAMKKIDFDAGELTKEEWLELVKRLGKPREGGLS